MTMTNIITPSRADVYPGIPPRLQLMLMEYQLLGNLDEHIESGKTTFSGDFRSLNISFAVETESSADVELMRRLGDRAVRELVWVADYNFATIHDCLFWAESVGETRVYTLAQNRWRRVVPLPDRQGYTVDDSDTYEDEAMQSLYDLGFVRVRK